MRCDKSCIVEEPFGARNAANDGPKPVQMQRVSSQEPQSIVVFGADLWSLVLYYFVMYRGRKPRNSAIARSQVRGERGGGYGVETRVA